MGMETGKVIYGDCLEVMKGMEDNSVDSVVCDPPYGLSKEPDIFEVLQHWMNGDDYEHKGGGFMGKLWDSFVPGPSVWKECFRLLKPGGYLLAFSSCRTWDLLSIAIRMAGFENRDTLGYANSVPCLAHIQGQGFPKSQNVARMIDQANGKSGIKTNTLKPGHSENRNRTFGKSGNIYGDIKDSKAYVELPVTEEAKRFRGYGTGIKPSWEVILMFRKPFKGPVYKNVLKYGTGAINVDATRIGYVSEEDKNIGGRNKLTTSEKGMYGRTSYLDSKTKAEHSPAHNAGRWPANVLISHHPECEYLGEKKIKGHKGYPNGPGGVYKKEYQESSNIAKDWNKFSTEKDNEPWEGYADDEGKEVVEDWNCHPECPVRMLDEQSGIRKTTWVSKDHANNRQRDFLGALKHPGDQGYNDIGGAHRFYYCSKAARGERELGLIHHIPCGKCGDLHSKTHINNNGKKENCVRNIHCTVKSISVLRWLVKLVTPPDGIIFDPFAGTGTCGIAAELEGFRYIGIELDEHYCDIADARIKYWTENKEEMLREMDKKKNKRIVKGIGGNNGTGKKQLKPLNIDEIHVTDNLLENFMVDVTE